MERNQSIDLVKIIAMLGVISLHCNLGKLDNPIAFLMSRLSGISIPLFFLVSGYLLVSKDGSYKYSLNKIYGILRFVFIITVSYWLLFSVPNGFELKKFLYFFMGSFFQKGPFWMFWYFGAMCLIYFFLPILIYLNKHVNKFFFKLFTFLICVDFIIFILTIQSHFEYNIPQSLRLYNWLTYFSLGVIIKENLNSNMNASIVGSSNVYNIIFCTISAFVFLGFVYYCKPYIGGIEYFFTTPFCMVYAFAVFFTITRLNIKNNKYIEQLSPLFLPVYTLHYFIIRLCRLFFSMTSLDPLSPFIDWAVISLITILISSIIMRNALIRNVFRI